MNSLNKMQKVLLIIAMLAVVILIGYYIYEKDSNKIEAVTDDEILVKDEEKKESTEELIVVHITGAVKKEGIVKLNENSRVADAIDAAGGLKEEADMSKINLAYVLEDGVKIKIPSINDKEIIEEDTSTDKDELVENLPEGNSQNKKDMVNINKANQTELETLPGIGPSIALKIINYRNENGKFSSKEEIKKVSGVGENKYENIKDYICIK